MCDCIGLVLLRPKPIRVWIRTRLSNRLKCQFPQCLLPEGASCHCFWVCWYVSAVEGNSSDAVTLALPSIWPQGLSRSCHQLPVFSCLYSPSLASRPTSCRCTSESAAAARLAPCPICLLVLPWRYVPGVVALAIRFGPRIAARPTRSSKMHQCPLLLVHGV
jgi:hypothetical protein